MTEQANILVSVIMPAFNSINTVERAINSVLSQTLRNFELIIVDDCSSDGSSELIEKKYSSDPRVSLIKKKNNIGAAKCRNIAIDVSKGDYIAFLDSDDEWKDNKLACQYEFAINSNKSFVFSNYIKVFEDGSGKDKVEIKAPQMIDSRLLRLNNFVSCCSVLIEIRRNGKIYFPELVSRHDYAYWFELLKVHKAAFNYNESSLVVYAQKNSLSKNLFRNIKMHAVILNSYAKVNKISFLGYYSVFLVLNFMKKNWTTLFNHFIRTIDHAIEYSVKKNNKEGQ